MYVPYPLWACHPTGPINDILLLPSNKLKRMPVELAYQIHEFFEALIQPEGFYIYVLKKFNIFPGSSMRSIEYWIYIIQKYFFVFI